MKKLLRLSLCMGLLAALLCVPSLAADQMPEKQGEFYVMINGEYVTFTDAVPQIRESRSCLPFAAVFEQLGFPQESMTWDADTQTVTAVKPDVLYSPSNGGEPQQGDLTVQLTIGSKEIKYWYENDLTAAPGGEVAQVTNVLESEVAPYLSGGRTYIPFGLLADALGYNVGWDSTVGAVIIDDVDAILAANTETYELMDQYQAYNRTFVEKNQKVTGKYAMELSMAENGPQASNDLSFTVKGDYDMITAGSTALQFDTDMTADADALMDGVDMIAMLTSPDGTPILPMDLGFSMRGDMTDGVFYFNVDSQQLTTLTGWNSESWYKLDMAAIYDEMSAFTGMNYQQLLELSTASVEKDFSQLLPSLLKDMPLTSVEFTTSDYLTILNLFCADSRFVQSGNRYVNTFLDDQGLTGAFTITTSAGKVNGYAMELKADPTVVGAEMTLKAAMAGNKMEIAMIVAGSQEQGEDLPQVDISLSLTMDGTYQTTSAQPQTEPPAGAPVVDLMELFGMEEIPTAA